MEKRKLCWESNCIQAWVEQVIPCLTFLSKEVVQEEVVQLELDFSGSGEASASRTKRCRPWSSKAQGQLRRLQPRARSP